MSNPKPAIKLGRIVIAAAALLALFWYMQSGERASQRRHSNPVGVQDVQAQGDSPLQDPVSSELTNQTLEVTTPSEQPAAARATVVSAQSEEQIDLSDASLWQPFSAKGKWGYRDATGNVTIEPQFEAAWMFNNGRAVVQVGTKFGYIDDTGRFVVDPDFDDLRDFHENIGIVGMNGIYSYVDTDGRPVGNNTFDYAWPHLEGVALVQVNGLYGYVDDRGEFIHPPVIETTFGFQEGLAAVQIDGRFGFIDERGRIAISSEYDYAWPFQNGEALVKSGDRHWFIDARGQYLRDHDSEPN